MFCSQNNQNFNENGNPEEYKNGKKSNEFCEKTLIQMIRLLLGVRSFFSPADIDIDR